MQKQYNLRRVVIFFSEDTDCKQHVIEVTLQNGSTESVTSPTRGGWEYFAWDNFWGNGMLSDILQRLRQKAIANTPAFQPEDVGGYC